MVNINIAQHTIVTLEEVQSTNSYALEHIKYLDDRTVIFTSHQKSGRGRYSRKWISDESTNIYTSIVLKPRDTQNYPFLNLTQYLSVVLCDFLKDEFNINANIKWPNDILVEKAKISGILAEAYTENNQINSIVLGLGLNVNLPKETLNTIDQKATSISVLKNQNYDTDIIIRKLMDKFFENYDEFVSKGFSFIKDKYISKCDFLGKNISIRENEVRKNYFAKAIDENGLLVAVDENNIESKIITGDIL